MLRRHIANFLLTSGLALGIGSAYAQPANDEMHGPGGMHAGMRMHGPAGMHGGGPMMHLRALNLTEAQHDQVFKIFHEQAPAFHEQMKQVRKARTELHQAAMADKYDEGRVRQLADAQARAVSALAVLHAQTMHRVREILTPEQRAKAEQFMQSRGMGMPR
jgi:periplasmic protein CpxP/Spy